MEMDRRKRWNVLLVDDDEDDYLITRAMLSQAHGRQMHLVWAPGFESGLNSLHTANFDAVLVDYDLGPQSGIELIRRSIAEGFTAPLILYTGRGSYQVDVEAMQAGATLYLTKGEITPLLLERSIRYAIERKQTETALRDSRQEVTQILESINDGFFAFDREWRYTYINHRAAEPLGYEPHELIGKNLWEVFPRLRGTIAEQHYRRAMEEGIPAQYRIQGVYSRRWYDINVYPSKDGIAVFFIDRTDEVEAEDALKAYTQQLERSNRALEDFAFIASHDLQEPLRKVSAFGELLRSRYSQELGEQGRDHIQRMQQAVERMQRMLDGLLAYSRVAAQEQEFEQVDLQQIAAETLADLEVRIAQTGGQVELCELPTIEAIPLQMRQLFQNLVANALKFHRPGVPPRVKISSRMLSDDRVQFRVTDNGVGFDPQEASSLFKLFRRLHTGLSIDGLGAGLAICQKIVELHGGSITASSVLGEGSVFTVELPVRQDQAR